jgi:hypothetical protein
LNPASESSPDLIENKIDAEYSGAGPEKNKKSLVRDGNEITAGKRPTKQKRK